MINITVYSHTNVDIENVNYLITNQADMVNFLKQLIDKVKYGGETICLEKAKTNSKEGKTNFTEIERW